MQLISQEEVIGLAFTPDDVINPANIRPARIEIAQLRYIRPTFGHEMYQNMILQQYNSFVSDYIKPALAHFIRYELIGELAVRASDLGVVKPSAENASLNTSATKNDLQNRTDTSREERNQLEVAEKNTTQTTLENTTKKVTDKTTREESQLHQNTKSETQNGTETDKKTTENTISEQVDTSISVTLTEEAEMLQDNLTKETTTTLNDSGETASQLTETDTSDTTLKVDTTDETAVNSNAEQNHVITKDLFVETSLQSENSSTSDSSKSTQKAADAAEWQLLARQALRDARTFLRYAVEHVEQNRDKFPDYAPVSGLGATAVRRCIGGIIL